MDKIKTASVHEFDYNEDTNKHTIYIIKNMNDCLELTSNHIMIQAELMNWKHFEKLRWHSHMNRSHHCCIKKSIDLKEKKISELLKTMGPSNFIW